ncbi:MAG: hypothetical protein AAF705_08560, partial [Bacteroidota bacterium]
MKILFILFAILSFVACTNQQELSEINVDVKASETVVERKDEVVITVDDDVQSFFTNVYLKELQDKPDMLNLGLDHERMSITIPTREAVKIIGGDPMVSFF